MVIRLLLMLAFASMAMKSFAQCTNATLYGTANAPTNNTPVTINACNFQNEYSTIFGILAGEVYTIGNSCGGYITVRRITPGGNLVANGNAPLTFTAPAAGTYYIHYNTNAACGTATNCCTTTITCTSCTGGGGGGCSNAWAYGSAIAPTNGITLTISPCTFQSEYNTISGVVAGQTYVVGNSCGGYITVRQGSPNGTVVASGNAPLTFTATVAGLYYFHYNTNAACGTANNCCETSITCTSCATSCPVIPPPGVDINSLAYQQVIADDAFCCNVMWDFTCQQAYDLATGGGGTGPVTAGDCVNAVNICTNFNFQINPNGFGSVYEIPALGTIGNPNLVMGDGVQSTWGTDHWGCLMSGELNSTWMVINIWGSGTLEFTFGGLGTQAGFYDWIMYPYDEATCGQIPSGNLPPIRCNWNDAAFGGTGLAATTPAGGSPGNFEPPLAVVAGQQYVICFSNWSSATTSVPLVFGGSAIVSCEDVTLPIELLGLSASNAQTGIDVLWSTASEENSAHFVVERSHDMMHWQDIGTQPAAGHSLHTLEYAFRDAQPMPGINFYRLRMVDIDGSSRHSDIASAPWNERPLVSHPNPSNGIFTVHASDEAVIRVYDALGAMVPARLQRTGDLRWHVTLPSAAEGVYVVQVEEHGTARQERMVITHR